ncbi:COQ9 family protein [Parvularcula oceani]|uniref:COQ9 family protein n=1 Tax=Parvularcula oceani TaxID=1247963 RepID=UPI0004E20C0A|nr:COQ9 family protein [Parvularcula oceani]
MAEHDSFEPLRARILDAALTEAPFDGWTAQMLERAARKAGMSEAALSRGDLHLAFPEGVRDLLQYWSEREDAAMAEAFDALNPKPHGFTARITWLVRRRIEQLASHREAARRAAATLALPQNAELGARLTWRTADRVWRAVGDSSTDFNHYTKRATLSAVYASTAAHWFADEGEGMPDPWQDSWDFLDRRIGNVMQFEKVKAQAQKAAPDIGGLVSMLGRLRYGSGR